ncbi:MAG: hypothetical protein ACJ8F7_15645, partial [Gemmataceae bacterium]
MSDPEPRSKKPAKPVRVNNLPDRYPKAIGVAPPPAEPTIAEPIPVATPLPVAAPGPMAIPVPVAQTPFAFEAAPAQTGYDVELVAIAPVRPKKGSLLFRVLRLAFFGAAALIMLVVGMEIGRWRAGKKYEVALKAAE